MTSSSEQQIGTQIEVPLPDRDTQESADSSIANHENQVHKYAQSVERIWIVLAAALQ